ncbi:MAG: BON domain-containing protein [Bryobacteraceae bacterium]|nr:BON domain-containing protein [Bryobacteraceae bacterium]
MRLIGLSSILLLICSCLAAAPQGNASDDHIYDQVRLKLAGDRDVRGTHIEVTVSDGVVTLRGQVDKEKNRRKAEKLAKKVKGVRQVVNELTLAPQ